MVVAATCLIDVPIEAVEVCVRTVLQLFDEAVSRARNNPN